MKPKRFKIKVCNNKFCLENSKDIGGYLRCKKKDIPICTFRNFCPDAHYRYFDYFPSLFMHGIEVTHDKK